MFSQLEVKTAVFASQDPTFLQVYKDGKDAYAMVASLAYNMPYDQCLEFYADGVEVNMEGKVTVCGDGKEIIEEIINNSFTLPEYRLINTPNGMVPASELSIGDNITTDEGTKTILDIQKNNSNITIKI